MAEEEKSGLGPATKGELALDVGAAILSAVPWLGGPVSQVLSGMSVGRKMGRVKEALDGLAQDLEGFRSDASEQYVKTEEFQELLENTLRTIAEERNEEKRGIYRAFLGGSIRTPGEPYDEQIRFIRTLQELQGEHIRILRAIMQAPEQVSGISGSQIDTLRKRLPDMPEDRIRDLVGQLNDLRVTKMESLVTMMTAHGAADLRHGITDYGKRFVHFIVPA